MSLYKLKSRSLGFAVSTIAIAFCLSGEAWAQIPGSSADSSRELQLDPDSPYHDPDIIYLEADELISDDDKQLLTAVGQVEGRYQDRTLRAERVIYNLETGRIVATGNVTLIDATGSAQFADKLELSSELEAGTATDFTSRLANGGTTGAKLAARRTDGGIDLYNAYYTACEPCEDSEKSRPPTWQIKARRVSQDPKRNMIRYNDAVFEFLGVPVMYTPYLAHPDPTVGRASGFLTPSFGLSDSKGLNAEIPYYITLDDYSELTLKPKVFSKVTPLMGLEYRRKFHSGEVNIDGSFTYASIFDREGNAFSETDRFSLPDEAPIGKRLRSHLFAEGQFKLAEDWDWGFGVQAVSDDTYLNRYDLSIPGKFGLYDSDGRRLVSQIFALGQDDDFRFSTSVYGFQSIRTTIRENDNPDRPFDFIISREDDSILPVAAPKIELNKYFTDPIVGGRLEAFGDVTILTRKVGTDYTRGTAGFDWNKTFVGPAGIEAKPFGQIRYDYFEFDPENAGKVDFDRATGQVGADIRWPFIRPGKDIDVVLEPRIQVTQNFGDGLNDQFTIIDDDGDTVSLLQDSIGVDLDDSLFWEANKSTGYDFWQKGFRADVGGTATALWDNSHASVFVGQSYASSFDDSFSVNSGLSGDQTDVVGAVELNINGDFTLNTRVRYDDDSDIFRRIDTGFSYTNKYFETDWRYYKIDDSIAGLFDDPLVPSEAISGGVKVKFTDNWSVSYRASRDIDQDVTRIQDFGIAFQDDCTLVELIYQKRAFDSDVVRDSEGLRIRFSLLTLGEFAGE